MEFMKIVRPRSTSRFKRLFLFLAFLVFNPTTFAQSFVEIETGTTSSNSNTITPWKTFFEDGRKQFIIPASELLAAGLNVGDRIKGFAFDVSFALATPSNITIGLKSTTNTSFSTFAFESGFTTVFSGSKTAAVGWDEIEFTSNYTWDGNGIVVQFCYNNSSFTGNSSVSYTDVGYNANRYAYTDNTDGCNMNSFGFNSNRPNLRFYYLAQPELISIERNTPSDSLIITNNVEWKVTFNERPTFIDTSDFELSGPLKDSVSIISIDEVSSNVYHVDATVNSSVQGVFGLNVKGIDGTGSNNLRSDNSAIDQQALSNAQVTNSSVIGQSFVPATTGELYKIVLQIGFGHSYVSFPKNSTV